MVACRVFPYPNRVNCIRLLIASFSKGENYHQTIESFEDLIDPEFINEE